MFEDREDAGKQVAEAVAERLGGAEPKDLLVLAIPRGGAEVGYWVARKLGARFSLLVTRKLPIPDNPETGFGAIAEDGSEFVSPDAAMFLPEGDIERIKKEQKEEIKRRVNALRGGRPLPQVKGRTVVLVDDGLATGSTMLASIRMCRNKKAKKVIVAVPVAGRDTALEIGRLADELIVLEQPPFFRAVAQVYRNWHDVQDEEVLEVMGREI